MNKHLFIHFPKIMKSVDVSCNSSRNLKYEKLTPLIFSVYSWKSNAGRAIEIKAFAGYDGASSIDSPSVQFRKAKRVVTTSHWLSNRGSMAHDFALVVFDQPFTDVTPFQYIETPPKDKVELGVVGYPADKMDEQTGEKGGKM
jgi:hypothetical protein